jgi:hypothetical protein
MIVMSDQRVPRDSGRGVGQEARETGVEDRYRGDSGRAFSQ